MELLIAILIVIAAWIIFKSLLAVVLALIAVGVALWIINALYTRS